MAALVRVGEAGEVAGPEADGPDPPEVVPGPAQVQGEGLVEEPEPG